MTLEIQPDSGSSQGGKRRRWPWVVLGVVVSLLALFYMGGGWYFSGQVFGDALAAEPYDPAAIETGTLTSVSIGSTGSGTVTITRDPASATETKNNAAVVGLKVGDTLLVAGPATSVEGAQVTRPVTETIGGTPRAGDRVGLVRDVWLDPKQAGMPFSEVSIAGPAGPLPAWWINGNRSGRWAVMTHGKGAARSEMLRMAGPLVSAGFNVLSISYTNDPGAPGAADGMVHYGATEWEDLQAAVAWALGQGADQLVLGGASHGAAVTLGFLAHSALADRVDALILDSPAASLRDVIDSAADHRTLPVVGTAIPESLQSVALWITARRYALDYGAISYTDMPGLLKVPTLVFAGVTDRTVPLAVTDRFAAAFPDQVTYVRVAGADHVLAWNVDPAAYETAEAKFLADNGLG